MTDLLIRLFVKDYTKTSDTKVRENYGTLSGLTGIVLNILLFIIKFSAGLITGAISVTADAFNNLSDAGSSIVTIIGFKLSSKPADEDHPFGHGRIEYLSGLAISIVICVVGVELFKESFGKIMTPETASKDILLPLILLICSVLTKGWMYLFNRKLSKKINSAAIAATATDSLTDSIATLAVIVGLVFGYFTDISLDGYLGCAVALFILYSGFKTAKDSLAPLLGQPADPEFVQQIKDIVISHKEIVGIHDLVIHDYGPGRCMVSLHAEVPCNADILEMHDVIDNIEMDLRHALHCVATIHMDPVDVEDETTQTLKSDVEEIVKTVDDKITVHDFRVVHGQTHTNLIFDAVTPYGNKMTDGEVASAIRKAVREKHADCFCVIQVEHSYTD